MCQCFDLDVNELHYARRRVAEGATLAVACPQTVVDVLQLEVVDVLQLEVVEATCVGGVALLIDGQVHCLKIQLN